MQTFNSLKHAHKISKNTKTLRGNRKKLRNTLTTSHKKFIYLCDSTKKNENKKGKKCKGKNEPKFQRISKMKNCDSNITNFSKLFQTDDVQS